MRQLTTKKAEHNIGHGPALTEQSLFSGPNIRRLGQEFSATNQGDTTTVYIPDIKEIIPDVLGSSKGAAERLTSAREAPAFWEIGSELEAYQQGASDQLRQDAAGGGGTERFASGSPAAIFQEDRLRNHLYRVGF
jgi:hypothetical protein